MLRQVGFTPLILGFMFHVLPVYRSFMSIYRQRDVKEREKEVCQRLTKFNHKQDKATSMNSISTTVSNPSSSLPQALGVTDDSSVASSFDKSSLVGGKDDESSSTKRKITENSDMDALNPSESIIEKKARIEDDETFETEEEKLEVMTKACRTILKCIGEDPDREGLIKTPERWAKALLFLTKGYKETVAEVTNNAVFTEDSHKEMVIVRDIDIHSMCEHHILPFTGRVHIGYIPNGKIIGISKLARIAEVFARRVQVQERLTAQIADALVEAVEPLGVAVVVECSHFCMVMRGIQKVGSSTVTSSVRGCFQSDAKTRAEFFSIIHQK